ncbi:hypothetical protein EMCRGX_G026029 [Ephydatia muelleri]
MNCSLTSRFMAGTELQATCSSSNITFDDRQYGFAYYFRYSLAHANGSYNSKSNKPQKLQGRLGLQMWYSVFWPPVLGSNVLSEDECLSFHTGAHTELLVPIDEQH